MRTASFFLSILITITAHAAPKIVKRVVVSLGRHSGTCVTTTAPDGTVTVAFDVLQNGRGPHVDATLRLAADGTIASLSATGHHEMGTKVAEVFTRDGRHVSWKSEEEHGEQELAVGSGFFIPIADLPEVLGLLTQALIKAGGKLPLLPAGEARLEKTTDATVHAGAQTRHLVGYAITGLDLTPTQVWMNDDGSWFGLVYPWFSVVPEGWESAIEPLIEKQNAVTHARDAKLARS